MGKLLRNIYGGMGTVLELFPGSIYYEQDQELASWMIVPLSDCEAFRSDWEQVGVDISSAFGQIVRPAEKVRVG